MTRQTEMLFKRILSLLPPELAGGEGRQLISSKHHSKMLSYRRARLIVNRVRLFAFLFAVLTPLWGVIDYIAFDAPLWLYLAGLRIAASMAFAALLFYYRSNSQMIDAYRAIALLFAIPTVFYIASHMLLSSQALSDFSAAVASGYAFLPFVLMAGLAIFPLTLRENLLITAVIFSAQLLAGYVNWSTLSWPSFVGGTWLLLLIAGVVAIASLSQLAFMMALVRQVMHDQLTGSYTRRAGEELLNLFWVRTQRQERPLSVAFIDLDHFKTINDTYGHEAGDQVLRNFSRLLREGLRKEDCLIRWGGEEFVLMMPETNIHQVREVLQRIQNKGFGLRPDGQPLTASIGIAESLHDEVTGLQLLIELSDQRMYHAKHAGRNQICASGKLNPL